MTKTYTFIDLGSGYVWGSATGETMEDAARVMDESIDPSAADGRAYVQVGRSELTGITGYAVYEGGLADDADGSQPETIEEVESRKLLGYLECVGAADPE